METHPNRSHREQHTSVTRPSITSVYPAQQILTDQYCKRSSLQLWLSRTCTYIQYSVLYVRVIQQILSQTWKTFFLCCADWGSVCLKFYPLGISRCNTFKDKTPWYLIVKTIVTHRKDKLLISLSFKRRSQQCHKFCSDTRYENILINYF